MKDSELTDIICRALGGIEGWEYLETAEAYPPDDVAVFYGAIGSTPNRAAGVQVYGASDPDEDEGPSSRRVQLRLRGRPRDRADADDMADEARPVLIGISRQQGISSISRQSMARLGADSNGREQRSENYLIILDNPEAST
jgi:hypothetical protein